MSDQLNTIPDVTKTTFGTVPSSDEVETLKCLDQRLRFFPLLTWTINFHLYYLLAGK